jgi:hypothetical protein
LQIGVCADFLKKVNGQENIPQFRKAAYLVPDIADRAAATIRITIPARTGSVVLMTTETEVVKYLSPLRLPFQKRSSSYSFLDSIKDVSKG